MRLMRQPLAGGAPQTVLELPYAQRSADFFCPRKIGKSCVLGIFEGESLHFYTLDPLRGKGGSLGSIEVDKDNLFGWQLSPDGSQAAVVDYSHKDRIEIFNLAHQAWNEIAVEPGWGMYQSVAWAADGKSLFVTTWLPDSFNLIHVTLSGKVQRLVTNAWRQWMLWPLPSPNGKYLAFQAQTWENNVWLMQNF
jgi:Tol biopolymer transport system component